MREEEEVQMIDVRQWGKGTNNHSFRFGKEAMRQITEMSEKMGMTKTMVLTIALDRMYVEKRKEGAL